MWKNSWILLLHEIMRATSVVYASKFLDQGHYSGGLKASQCPAGWALISRHSSIYLVEIFTNIELLRQEFWFIRVVYCGKKNMKLVVLFPFIIEKCIALICPRVHKHPLWKQMQSSKILYIYLWRGEGCLCGVFQILQSS